jgi:hypothetical protein
MFRTIILTTLIVGLLANPVVAQDSATSTPTPETSTPTVTSTSTATPTTAPTDTADRPPNATDNWHSIYGEPDIYVRFYNFQPDTNTMTIVFSSERAKVVRISTPAGEDGRGTVVSHVADNGRTKVTVTTPDGRVWLSTKDSLEAGYYTELRDQPTGLFPNGPYDKADTRNAAAGASISIGIAVLLEAIRRKLGAGKKGERIDV